MAPTTMPIRRAPQRARPAALPNGTRNNQTFVPIYYDPEIGDRFALAKHRDLIRPGAVLWFSRQKPAKSGGLQPLFTRQINHMGTVVSVERNEAGEVVRYKMYHGRSKGKKARVTEHHYWQWPSGVHQWRQAIPAARLLGSVSGRHRTDRSSIGRTRDWRYQQQEWAGAQARRPPTSAPQEVDLRGHRDYRLR